MDIQTTIKTLETLLGDSAKLAELSETDRVALMRAAGLLSRPSRGEQRERNKALKKMLHKKRTDLDRAARATTGIRRAREAAVFVAPTPQLEGANQTKEAEAELQTPRNCYVCKAEFKKLHFFYD